MNNKNPETDIRVKVEEQKSKADKPLECPHLYQGSDKQKGDTILNMTTDFSALYQTSKVS